MSLRLIVRPNARKQLHLNLTCVAINKYGQRKAPYSTPSSSTLDDSRKHEDYDLVIVGGGPAGLALASALGT